MKIVICWGCKRIIIRIGRFRLVEPFLPKVIVVGSVYLCLGFSVGVIYTVGEVFAKDLEVVTVTFIVIVHLGCLHFWLEHLLKARLMGTQRINLIVSWIQVSEQGSSSCRSSEF